MNPSTTHNRSWFVAMPGLKDPRCTLAVGLTLWTVLGQTAYYFNRDLLQLGVAVASACVLDFVILALWKRELSVPLSAYITALSIGLLVESYDWRVYVVVPAWGILSKYLLRDRKRHFFNPSNFGIVMVLLFGHGIASVAPGSQWGADYRVALAILCLGMMMLVRLKKLELGLGWLGGFVFMGLVRVALRHGGLVFALGPMTGAEFALFTFSMLPDPKTCPPTRRGCLAWGVSIALMDGVLRYLEVRYSMFYALFAHCAVLPVLRAVAARGGFEEDEPWRIYKFPFRSRKPAASTGSSGTYAPLSK